MSGLPEDSSNAGAGLHPVLRALRALRDGDFTARVQVAADAVPGVHTELADTVNQLATRAEHLAGELTRVRANVVRRGRVDERLTASPGQGMWTDSVHAANTLLETLLGSTAEATRVLAAVADGDLSRRVDLHEDGRALRGELRRLGRTVNRMTDQLALFTDEVTRAALDEDGEGTGRGPGGKHGGPVTAHTTVSGLSGSWRDAAEAVNRMVSDLRETTQAKEWLESNLTRLASLMQGRRDIREIAEPIMRELPPLVGAQFGAFFLAGNPEEGAPPGDGELSYVAGYGTAAYSPGARPRGGVHGHSLIAQVAAEKRRLLLTDLPPDYLPIGSGLGEARPACVVILPVLYEDTLLGVLELASFSTFSDIHLAFFDQFVHTMGVALHTIRANTALSEKAALLAASSQYKTQFLANMSHELRTPLNSLLVLSRLLADNEGARLSEEEVRFAQTIHRSGTDLLSLINDVLDLAKIESGRMEARPHNLTLTKLLTYVEDTFRPIAHDRGLRFSVTSADDAPGELHVDERRLQQVLRNLLSNAMKFTADGSVELHAEPAAERGNDGEPLIAFRVRDTGIGIEPEQLPRIFEAFQQGDGSSHRTYGGTGLGLAISRELAELLGGRISVESTPGAGSTFTLYVPASSPAAPAGGAPQAAEPPAAVVPAQLPPPRSNGCSTGSGGGSPADRARTESVQSVAQAPESGLTAWQSGHAARVLRDKRVLIVDDDIRNVYALTHLLGRVGMSVRYAENGSEALTTLEGGPSVDVVLMDIMMPKMDGYEAIRNLRADPRFEALPVVALTAQAMPGDGEQSLSAGASAYVPKPVAVEALLGTLLSLLDRHSSPRPR
ncbi:response regulator [Streptomyces bathyalis]|uniref:Circadian input-output histidine kinase CikA n=1 Tax=Streptomyces bathyalis TaxID=2710756 RepID=A0A7T1T9K0_9ACTN|nr:ATP-binding protein [Streptomyces bathyalis]QPP08917.1 response regulator [Streptomyces bathyalis]